MTNEQLHYDRKKLIVLRAVLTVIGGAIGGLAMWQYFLFYPNVMRREFTVVVTVVSSIFTAAVFALSAKAFYRLGASIAGCIVSASSRIGLRGMTAVILGFIAAGAAVLVFDVSIRGTWDIWAVRLLGDVLLYIACASIFCYGFTKWLNAPKEESKAACHVKPIGYLLSADCFRDDRVFTAADVLINVKVCDGAYVSLCRWDSDGAALKRLDSLVESGRVSVLNTGKIFDGKAEYERTEKELAGGKRLKLVGLSDECDCDMSLSAFVSADAQSA